MDETWTEQYYASGISVTAGAKIQFSHQGTPINSGIGANPGNNNAVGHSDNITVHNDSFDSTIYFQVYSDGYGIWLTGYDAGGGAGGGSSTDTLTASFTINYGTNSGEAVYLIGDFCSWSITGAIRGTWTEGNNWVMELSKAENESIAYKYVIAPSETPATNDGITRWEKDPNHEYTFTSGNLSINDSWQA